MELTREQKIKLAKREYMRRYREKNRDRIQENVDNFWLKKFNEFELNEAIKNDESRNN